MYVGTECSFDEFKETIQKNWLNSGDLLRESDQELAISCDSFTIKAKKGGQEIVFAKEDYCLELNYQCWFDVYHAHSNWLNDLMRFVGKLLRNLEGDAVLLSNGDKPILMRKENKVIVADEKINHTKKFPFHELGLSYQAGKLEFD
ncbi:hypothetical protein [Acetonema longum]|uniref:hypothetical protein n=1 Tax=Acetonema longum TaxID=2374 RepID=UPI0011123BD7|nr:hypothetical protein [Acetonema longum]